MHGKDASNDSGMFDDGDFSVFCCYLDISSEPSDIRPNYCIVVCSTSLAFH